MNTQANTAVATATETPNPAQLNLVPPPTQAELDAIEAKALEAQQATKKQAIAKFETVVPFKLEQETVGAKAIARSVSSKGAVKVGIASKKDCKALSGLSGGDLDAWMRMRQDELKGKQSLAAAALSSDNNWSGKAIELNAKGDTITMKWKKVLPQTISIAAPTDEQMAKQLDMTVDEFKAFKASHLEAKAKEKAAQELAAEAEKAGLTVEEYMILKDDPTADQPKS